MSLPPPRPWPMCPVCGACVPRRVRTMTTTIKKRRRATSMVLTGGLSLLAPRRKVPIRIEQDTVCSRCGAPS